MSGTGRSAADFLESGEAPRKRGHRSRWEARIEGLDGRTVKAVKVRRNRHDDTETDVRNLRIAGFRVR